MSEIAAEAEQYLDEHDHPIFYETVAVLGFNPTKESE